jgi:hypothetical protein
MERINKLEAEVSKLHNELIETKQMAQQQEMVWIVALYLH